MISDMMQHHLKLGPKLFDLFQHCELKCNAACCGWDAFDFSDRWLTRWCEFRDNSTIRAARDEIVRIVVQLNASEPDSKVAIDRFFNPTVESLIDRLSRIGNLIDSQTQNDTTTENQLDPQLNVIDNLE
jgi:hypothetical protein